MAKNFDDMIVEALHYTEGQLEMIRRFRTMLMSDALAEIIALLQKEKEEAVQALKMAVDKRGEVDPKTAARSRKKIRERLAPLEHLVGVAASEMTDLPLARQFFKEMFELEQKQRTVYRAIFHRHRDSQTQAAWFLNLAIQSAGDAELIKNIRRILEDWPQDTTQILLRPRGV